MRRKTATRLSLTVDREKLEWFSAWCQKNRTSKSIVFDAFLDAWKKGVETKHGGSDHAD